MNEISKEAIDKFAKECMEILKEVYLNMDDDLSSTEKTQYNFEKKRTI